MADLQLHNAVSSLCMQNWGKTLLTGVNPLIWVDLKRLKLSNIDVLVKTY